MTKTTADAMDVPEQAPKRGGNRCGVIFKGRPPCKKTAGWGTDHVGRGPCRNHGGNLPGVVASVRKELAAEVLARYGAPRRIDPRDGVIEEYWRTAGAVAYCEARVHELDEQDLMWGVVEESDGAGEQGSRVVKRRAVPNVWLAQYERERDRFAKLGLEIIRLGLEERRDQAAERLTLQFAGVVRLFVAELGLSAEQQARVPAALAAAVAALPAAGQRAAAS